MLAQGKDNALLRFTLGSHYLKEGDAEAAIEHLQAAVAHDASYSAAWKLLGKALAALGRSADAIAAYRTGIAAAGKLLGKALAALGRREEAMEAFRAGIAAAEKRGDKQAAKEMAVFLRRLEKEGGAA